MLISAKILKYNIFTGIIFLFLWAPLGHAQTNNLPIKNSLGQNQVSYDDMMAIIIDSNLVVDIIVRKVKKLPPSQSIGAPIGKERLLITANVQSLIRADRGINSEIKFLYDAPVNSRGKIPKLKKQRFFAFGRNVANRPDFIKLTYTDSILPYDAQMDLMIRSAITEVIAPNAAQKITGISSAFHSPGTIIGEGETQIFLNTEFRQPMALSVVSTGNQSRSWSLSTSEVIDINATEPRRSSLLGHRLACSLPQNIEPSKIESSDPRDSRKAADDYNFVKNAIGPCVRNIRWGQ